MVLAEEQRQDQGASLGAEQRWSGSGWEEAAERRAGHVVVRGLWEPEVVAAAGGVHETAATLRREWEVREADDDDAWRARDHLEAALFMGL